MSKVNQDDVILLKFDPEEDEWQNWKERFENFIEWTEMPKDKQRGLLLNSLGVKAFQKLVSLCRPKRPREFDLDELLVKLDTAYTTVTFRAAEWADFYSMVPGDLTLEEFAERLRDKTTTCKFPAEVVEDNLSAAFIRSINNQSTRLYLLTHEHKTFSETLDAAKRCEKGLEDSRKSTKDSGNELVAKISKMKSKRSNGKIQTKVQSKGKLSAPNVSASSTEDSEDDKPPKPREKGSCDSCGGKNHVRERCWYRNAICNKCGRKGHIERACRSGQDTERENKYIYTDDHEPYDVL
ncbi:uncharacterized protein LOC129597409 [Paramacrobiotus metropolitanus]|uniref:uncharacterized protein LOC129597409 n=1 Tax=Paramacrobiotus metropolitanus TaxID=2943436 RepID=UPI002446006C|nr:uncharacterized protein LOC129597409 [Paramacrobiotus metropolitanus]